MNETDTLAEWLYCRFLTDSALRTPWDCLTTEDKSFWEHEANAVRRAVARGGFKESK